MTDSRNDTLFPIEEVVPGFRIHGLFEGAEPEDVYVLIKTRDADGDSGWSLRMSNNGNPEELLGALISQADWLRQHLLTQWDG